MKCDECGKNEASIHLVNIEQGVTSESYLCGECAAQGGMLAGSFSLKDMFTSFIQPRVQEKACSKCGSTIADIKKTGFAGCEQCYTDLREDLLPMLKAMHGSIAHVGEAPQQADNPSHGENELVCLRNRLHTAIGDEKYEEAAQLRDRIRLLEAAKGGPDDA